MLLWVTIMVTIVGIGVLYRKGDSLGDIPGLLVVCLTAISGIVAFVCGAFFIGSHSPYFRREAMIELEQKRNAILYVMEKNEGSIVGLASDISGYNSAVLSGRMRMHNIWLKNISYDFYDELELIEVSVDG